VDGVLYDVIGIQRMSDSWSLQ